MTYSDGYKWFGYFNGMEYCPEHNEAFEQYKEYKNILPKAVIARHIESLDAAFAAFISKDIFTGEELENAGMYIDGKFLFPTDFLRYFKKYDIGIPPEYEKYLIEEVGLKG